MVKFFPSSEAESRRSRIWSTGCTSKIEEGRGMAWKCIVKRTLCPCQFPIHPQTHRDAFLWCSFRGSRHVSGSHWAFTDVRSLHWPHILQILVPTFSAFSVAQGYVSSDPEVKTKDEELGRSLDDHEFAGMGEEAAERRRRMEEERRGRMCPICLGKPVAGRMTKCGHVSIESSLLLTSDLLLSLYPPLYSTI